MSNVCSYRTSVQMNEKILHACFVLLNMVFVGVLGLSVLIYTSRMSERLPWYTPEGLQFLTILVFCCPAFLVVGVLQLFLSRFRKVSMILRILPFVSIPVLGLPIVIDPGLGLGVQVSGMVFGLVAIGLTGCSAVNQIKTSTDASSKTSRDS